MIARTDVEIANVTDPGCERSQNEDYYCYLEPDNDEDLAARGRLMAIADGMGGHRGGEVASRLAIEALQAEFEGGTGEPATMLERAFSAAQRSILAYSNEHPETGGMGTTCTAAIIRQRNLFYGHVGDSRLYLLREGRLQQMTDDHSLVNELIKNGTITDQQAAVHEKRNVLTSALGMTGQPPTADFSTHPVTLEDRDVIVLATDGLHGLVSATEIAQTVIRESAYNACRYLVDLARDRGGPDNITIQVLRVQSEVGIDRKAN